MRHGSTAYARLDNGLRMHVRLTPRSAKEALGGWLELADGSTVLKARVRAVPEDGKANAALVKLVAATFDVAATAVTLEAGSTARIKTLMLHGNPDVLEARLQMIVSLAEPTT